VKVLALYNLKGGVGKTASAVNLAWLAAAEGFSTLLWDLDPQAAATYTFRLRPKVAGGAKRLVRGAASLDGLVKASDYPGLDVLPADLRLRKLDRILGRADEPRELFARLLQELEGAYDLVILDTPPALGATAEAVFVAADGLLLPTIPTALSIRALEIVAEFTASRKRYRRLRLLPFFCMVDRRKRLHREIADRTTAAGLPVCAARIPYNSAVERMSDRREPLPAYDSSGPAAHAYRELWREVRTLFGLRPG
jgi:cellulose biosynthesis protein BcsQ